MYYKNKIELQYYNITILNTFYYLQCRGHILWSGFIEYPV